MNSQKVIALPINRDAKFVLFEESSLTEGTKNITTSKKGKRTSKSNDDSLLFALKRLKLDFKGKTMDEIIAEIYPEDVIHCDIKRESIKFNINLIQKGLFYLAKSEKTGRIFTNVSNLTKGMRPYLTLDGQNVAEIDIKSSQPLLLHTLYKDKTCNEAKTYKFLVESGEFYNFLNRNLKKPTEKRKLKKRLYLFLFGKRNVEGRYPNQAIALDRIFKECFPILSQIIEDKKKINHADLPIALQKLESSIVVDKIARECYQENIPIVTIHDSFLSLPQFLSRIKDKVIKSFQEMFNLTPALEQVNYF